MSYKTTVVEWNRQVDLMWELKSKCWMGALTVGICFELMGQEQSVMAWGCLSVSCQISSVRFHHIKHLLVHRATFLHQSSSYYSTFLVLVLHIFMILPVKRNSFHGVNKWAAFSCRKLNVIQYWQMKQDSCATQQLSLQTCYYCLHNSALYQMSLSLLNNK